MFDGKIDVLLDIYQYIVLDIQGIFTQSHPSTGDHLVTGDTNGLELVS